MSGPPIGAWGKVEVTVRPGVTISVWCRVLAERELFGRKDYLVETETGDSFWANRILDYSTERPR